MAPSSLLCGGEYDGAHIGPEPTTEKFVAVVGVPSDQPKASKRGNYVSMMPSLPFGGLAQYAIGARRRAPEILFLHRHGGRQQVVGDSLPNEPRRRRPVERDAWSALVGMRKREARDAAKAELAAE